MPRYSIIDASRGDSFTIPPQYYHIDDVDHVGDVPPAHQRGGLVEIALARHHIISWSILHNAWNRCVETDLIEVCRNLIRLLTEQASDDSMPADVSRLCWARRNLIIGPLGNDRLFDPGEGLDFESPLGMQGKRLRHVCAMVKLGKTMDEFRHKRMSPKDFAARFGALYKDCMRVSGDEICTFERSEWTLNIKPTITWVRQGNTYSRQGAPTAPRWHRSCYTPGAVAKYFAPGTDPDLARIRTAHLRSAAHTRFVKSLDHDELVRLGSLTDA